jgi:alkanesulfonate monooxygenase SsuD/methylene tetrahydromethanopterin reductase-like flavin-dependent oxidoreductase (luciferase family)
MEAERLGLNILWVGDVPVENYASAMALAIAEKTRNIRIGLGLVSPLLHRPNHIASMIITLVESYGPRFELCIGPGDRNRLTQVGVKIPTKIVESMLSASKVIRDKLKKHGLRVRLWLGAQGPKMIKASGNFDGVLLNLSSPRMVQWAINTLERKTLDRDFRVGVFAVSYVYNRLEEKVYRLATRAASLVSRGASNQLLEEFGYRREIEKLRLQLKNGKKLSSRTLLPEKLLKEFSIIMNYKEFRKHISILEGLGVKDLVLAYPQNHSMSTIRSLNEEVLDDIKRNSLT